MKAVKARFSAIVNALNNIYAEQTHEPETLGISRALSKLSTVSLLDYVLPMVANMSRTLLAERIDS